MRKREKKSFRDIEYEKKNILLLIMRGVVWGEIVYNENISSSRAQYNTR